MEDETCAGLSLSDNTLGWGRGWDLDSSGFKVLLCCCVVVRRGCGKFEFYIVCRETENQHADTVGLQLKHNYNGTFCQISHLSNIVDEIPSESEDFLSQYWRT